ncbi:MAG: hypothetical protein PHR77_18615 [Kiritimatiellae bacterium]|nr:hypothetical protein [Kiritimatiellia bacterium]MDD5520396.1 hypothetical protein [Kiritimatiellia bacterium]
MNRKLRRKEGQTLVEYIILVVIIAIAVIAIAGVFSDRIRSMFGGATLELGGEQDKVNEATQTESKDFLKQVNKDGPISGN